MEYWPGADTKSTLSKPFSPSLAMMESKDISCPLHKVSTAPSSLPGAGTFSSRESGEATMNTCSPLLRRMALSAAVRCTLMEDL